MNARIDSIKNHIDNLYLQLDKVQDELYRTEMYYEYRAKHEFDEQIDAEYDEKMKELSDKHDGILESIAYYKRVLRHVA